MSDFINLKLLANPINWLIVTLMLVLFMAGADVIFKQFSRNS